MQARDHGGCRPGVGYGRERGEHGEEACDQRARRRDHEGTAGRLALTKGVQGVAERGERREGDQAEHPHGASIRGDQAGSRTSPSAADMRLVTLPSTATVASTPRPLSRAAYRIV